MLLFEGIRTTGLLIRKAVVCLKYCLISHPSRNMEDSGSESDLNCECLYQEVSEEKNVNMWPRDQSCNILEKNVTVFWPWCKESA